MPNDSAKDVEAVFFFFLSEVLPIATLKFHAANTTDSQPYNLGMNVTCTSLRKWFFFFLLAIKTQNVTTIRTHTYTYTLGNAKTLKSMST